MNAQCLLGCNRLIRTQLLQKYRNGKRECVQETPTTLVVNFHHKRASMKCISSLNSDQYREQVLIIHRQNARHTYQVSYKFLLIHRGSSPRFESMFRNIVDDSFYYLGILYLMLNITESYPIFSLQFIHSDITTIIGILDNSDIAT